MKKGIIFVCNGNIERSPIAAECFKNILKEHKISSKFTINSCGLKGTKGTALPRYKHLSLYPKEGKAAESTLKRLNIDISKHSFQKITLSIVEKASVIIAMDKKTYSENKNALLKQFPKQKNKIHIISELTIGHKDIKDPAGSHNKELHRKVIQNIYSILNDNYKTILDWTK